jgi:hypothetical protein
MQRCRRRPPRSRPPDTGASRDSLHYRFIQSLDLTVAKDANFIRSFDAFRKKRNVSNYDIGGGISDRGVQEMHKRRRQAMDYHGIRPLRDHALVARRVLDRKISS